MGESTKSAIESVTTDLNTTIESNSKSVKPNQIDIDSKTPTTKSIPLAPTKESLTTDSQVSSKLGGTMTDQAGIDKNQEKKPMNNVSAVYGDYEDYQILPEAPWPPPIFIRQGLSPQERYYLEHRWYSQWSFFDSKATQNKNRYYRTQIVVGLGSVTVPVLVGINAQGIAADVLYFVTVFISLSVAMATAIEALYTFGDNWRSYRSAAEDLHQEKSLYDVKAGRYMNNKQAFIRFVERCEEIIAQQNGRWVQSQEKAAEQIRDDGDELLDRTISATDQFGNPIATTATTTTTITTEPTLSTEQPIMSTETYQEEVPSYSEAMGESPIAPDMNTNLQDTEAYSDPDSEDPMNQTSYG